MSMYINKRVVLPAVAVALAVLILVLPTLGASPKAKSSKTAVETVQTELFDAVKADQVEVKLIPKDSTECNVQIINKTDKQLSVKLPNAFAGVPILAAGGGTSSTSTRSTSSSSNSQGVGGGYGSMGGGYMNIAPEKVAHFKLPVVCLDHGKQEPRASVKYEMRPIESYTSKPGVQELCTMLGNGQISQKVAQAATWYLNNDVSWETLASKRNTHINGTSEPVYSPQELQMAMRLATQAVQTAQQRKLLEPQPSSTDELSNPTAKN
jgi:hypothetical protein